jgi:hypothetical protein
MNAAHIQGTFRGVSCRFCLKPLKLSASFIQREKLIKQEKPGLIQELRSQVFVVRCRSCHGEAIYSLDQISEYPEENLV